VIEHPILFSAPMVRAILEGRKTQTRRVLTRLRKLGPASEFGRSDTPGYDWHFRDRSMLWNDISQRRLLASCPHGEIGHRLWVRETWAELLAVSPASDMPIEITEGERLIEPPTSWVDTNGRTRWNYDGKIVAYRANSDMEFCDGDGFSGDFADRRDMPRWRPSIHMPRWASRILLDIVDVRAERLQDITREDAAAEGVCLDLDEPPPQWFRRDRWPEENFAALWDSLNVERGLGWNANPWVWVVSFRRVQA
jgi:hypothetical protein